MSIKDMQTKKALGTIEMFHREAEDEYNHYGVLRIDLGSDYERREIIEEILYLANRFFYEAFHVKKILTKAVPAAEERIAALKACGYQEAKAKLMGKYGDYFCNEKYGVL